jgi:hypothetical protein
MFGISFCFICSRTFIVSFFWCCISSVHTVLHSLHSSKHPCFESSSNCSFSAVLDEKTVQAVHSTSLVPACLLATFGFSVQLEIFSTYSWEHHAQCFGDRNKFASQLEELLIATVWIFFRICFRFGFQVSVVEFLEFISFTLCSCLIQYCIVRHNAGIKLCTLSHKKLLVSTVYYMLEFTFSIDVHMFLLSAFRALINCFVRTRNLVVLVSMLNTVHLPITTWELFLLCPPFCKMMLPHLRLPAFWKSDMRTEALLDKQKIQITDKEWDESNESNREQKALKDYVQL